MLRSESRLKHKVEFSNNIANQYKTVHALVMKKRALSASARQVRVFPRQDSEVNLVMVGEVMKSKVSFEGSVVHHRYCKVIRHMIYDSNLNRDRDQGPAL